jgi:dihydrofolate synthase/folylpolyglutamate synthase
VRTLSQWLDWQSSLNPAEIDLGLQRVKQVWDRLTPADLESVVITVAGTNGKGSSVALLEAILQAGGYTTGSYTSPHILNYNERIRLDGIPVSDQLICDAFQRIEQARQELPLTYFEFGTLAALLICADAAVDVCILEVGLGGRLDAVNIIDADAALVTSIALDHQNWLGDDRESIGREKAGIFRAGKPAVFSSDDPPLSLLEYAGQIGAPLYLLGRDYQLKVDDERGWTWLGLDTSWQNLPNPALPGAHQLRNAAGVLMILQSLADRLPLDQSAIEQGLGEVHIDGRSQFLSGRINWLLDVAHNPHAVNMLADRLRAIKPPGRVVAVLGMLNDKDAASAFQIMQPLVDEWHLTGLDEPRAYTAGELQQQLELNLLETRVVQHSNIRHALDSATRSLGAEDLLLVFGSFHMVAGALQWRKDHADLFQGAESNCISSV